MSTPTWKPPYRQPFIRTVSGRYVNLLDPDPSTICIEDIAYHLSNICRFTGACVPFYSVAKHSVVVSYLCPPEVALQGLLHDATEAYLGDIASPLKYSGVMDRYLGLEAKMEQAIGKALGIEFPAWAMVKVKEHDEEAFGMEWAALMEQEPSPEALLGLQAMGSEQPFLERYQQLRMRRLES